MESIRQLNTNEVDTFLDLIEYAFHREQSTPAQREEHRAKVKPDEIWGYFLGDVLAATVQVIPLQVFVQGRPIAMGLIAGVASWPEHRRRGFIGKLLIKAIEVMKQKGQTIAYLAPFSFAFYRKYGWEIMNDIQFCRLDQRSMPQWEETPGRMERVAPDITLLNDLYEQYALRYNGMVKRSEERWQESVLAKKKGTIAVYYDGSGEPRGYLIYAVTKREMTIHEMVYLDAESQRSLWNFVRKHDSMLNAVIFEAPADNQLQFLLSNPKGLEKKALPDFMARITDVQTFLNNYAFLPSGVTNLLTLHVCDEQAPWNHGTFRVRVDERGQASATPSNDGEPYSGLRCDIGTLSTMLMGYQRPDFLYDIGRLKGARDEVTVWDALIPRSTPCYLDFGS